MRGKDPTNIMGEDPWINLEKMQWPEEDHGAIVSDGRGDGVPDNHGDARGILEKRNTTPTTV
jgi:hypothetical protein